MNEPGRDSRARKRHRSWCFTIASTVEVPILFPNWRPELDLSYINYAICQPERAASGLVHIQGYLQLKNPQTLERVKLILDRNHAHLEVARGTPAENRAYCSKEETQLAEPWEYGDLPQPGHRSDIDDFIEALRSNGGKLDFSETSQCKQVLLRPGGVSQLLRSFHNPARAEDTPLRVFVLYGAPGTGKSRGVRDSALVRGYRLHVFLPPKSGTLWFDGYDNQEVALIDDFADDIPYPLMLRLMDRYDK